MASIQQVGINEIHQSYRAGKLEYLVGAGASIDAGLPNWNTLNHHLLRNFFLQEFGAQETELLVPPEPDELEALARIFVARFGREPVVDVIRGRLQDENAFRELVRKALYGAPGRVELQSIQYELVAALQDDPKQAPHRILTTNFDNLLERAYCRLNNYDDSALLQHTQVIASKAEQASSTKDKAEFVHLHGYLPETQRAHGRLVLSERDFFETGHEWPTSVLHSVLSDPERDLLIVGMSLADPRLRRLLLERAKAHAATGSVFVLLAESTADEASSLAVRRAHKLLGRYELQYWDGLDVKVHLVSNLEMLPMLLRKIRLGDAPNKWCRLAREFLEDDTAASGGDSIFDRLYSELKQREARVLIEGQLEYIRRLFEVDVQEELTLGFFVPSPVSDGHIQLAFRYNDRFEDKDYVYPPSTGGSFQGVTEERGEKRQLDVTTIHQAQGAAGYAFTTGTVVQAVDSSKELNRAFSPEMLADWDGGRTFSSLLCVPISGGPNWLPLGVGFISSNRQVPFWTGFPSEEALALHRLIRSTFKQLVGFSGHHG